MKPTLLVLAAGMGSRYGGLKQLDQIGPAGETIMDYSVYDAIEAGFGKVVFVIRKSFAQQFKDMVVPKYGSKVELAFVEQELDKLPEGFVLNPSREKPWGTGHAMLMAKSVIDTPFAVINSDDFYGRESFKVLADFFASQCGCSADAVSSCAAGVANDGKQALRGSEKDALCGSEKQAVWSFAMDGFSLGKTLSESGGVSRGLCQTNAEGFLTTVVEHHNILREADGALWADVQEGEKPVKVNEQGAGRKVVDAQSYCSMNFWGFTPQIFDYTEQLFKEFLTKNGNEPKKEFYIPYIVNSLIEKNMATVKVIPTPAQWFGVTFKEDRPIVAARFAALAKDGTYPKPLF